MYGSVADYDLSRPYTSMVLNIPAVGYQATVAKQERFNVQEAINGDVELKEKQEKKRAHGSGCQYRQVQPAERNLQRSDT